MQKNIIEYKQQATVKTLMMDLEFENKGITVQKSFLKEINNLKNQQLNKEVKTTNKIELLQQPSSQIRSDLNIIQKREQILKEPQKEIYQDLKQEVIHNEINENSKIKIHNIVQKVISTKAIVNTKKEEIKPMVTESQNHPKITSYDLEAAFMKNTKSEFGNKNQTFQKPQPNIAQTYLRGDQKIFQISSDFEIEEKLKTPVLHRKIEANDNERKINTNPINNIQEKNSSIVTTKQINSNTEKKTMTVETKKVVVTETIEKKNLLFNQVKTPTKNIEVNFERDIGNLLMLENKMHQVEAGQSRAKYNNPDIQNKLNQNKIEYNQKSQTTLTNADLTNIYLNNTNKKFDIPVRHQVNKPLNDQPILSFVEMELDMGWREEKNNKPPLFSKSESPQKATINLDKQAVRMNFDPNKLNQSCKKGKEALFNEEMILYPIHLQQTKTSEIKQEPSVNKNNLFKSEQKTEVELYKVREEKILPERIEKNSDYFAAFDEMHMHFQPNHKEKTKKLKKSAVFLDEDDEIGIRDQQQIQPKQNQAIEANKINVIKKVFGKGQNNWNESVKSNLFNIKTNEAKKEVSHKSQSMDRTDYKARVIKDRELTEMIISQDISKPKLEMKNEQKNQFSYFPAEEHHLMIEKLDIRSPFKKDAPIPNDALKKHTNEDVKKTSVEIIIKEPLIVVNEEIPVFGLNVEEHWDESILEKEI
jgi:hypothetical protein